MNGTNDRLMGTGQWHARCQRQGKGGWKQASLSSWKMKYHGVVMLCISSQISGRPRADLSNGSPLRPNRNRSSYNFSHKDKTRRQEKLRVQTFASCSWFAWQEVLKTYELTHYPGHHQALTSLLLFLPRVGFKATDWHKGHRGPYQSSGPITTRHF